MNTMAERLDEAMRLMRRHLGTPYERASMAYMASQIEQAEKNRRPTTAGKGTR